MTNQASTGERENVTKGGAPVLVDPALLARVKNAGRPQQLPRAVKPPPSMPGTLSAWSSVEGLARQLFEGIAHPARLRDQYGDIHQTSFIGVPMVIVWDADEIQKILKNEEQLWSTAIGWDAIMFQRLDMRSANVGSLLTLDFDDHRIARKLVQPAFTLRAIEGYLSIADRWFAPAIDTWVARGRVAFKREVRTLLAGAANEIFTGIRDTRKVESVDNALSDFWHGMMAVVRNPWLSPTFRKSQRGLASLLQTFLALVPERRRSEGSDLFTQMCRVTETDGLDDEAMVRVFLTIMFGAFDTTSAAVTSMAYLLARHPYWQERLREEAIEAGTEAPGIAAMKNMKKHEWVWKETLRLMPVNGFVPRCALRDTTVKGHSIRAGTLVMPVNGGIGRHPKWWRDPTKFDPERFSPERAEDKQHPGIFNPFGGGAHACVGMQLANFEMKLFFHRMLTSCRFRLTREYEARHCFTPMGIVTGNVDLTLERLRR